ncbi:MAG: F0F1 ATP synthase subunit gamma, partial [Acidimicrobiaceae bacterium]|nr:F0F1 ATP synthase subunit gamma [Acidimicrobiaceae bacterium]
SRAMNQARQDAITTEIMEIVGGAEALGGGDTTDVDIALASMLAGTDASMATAAGTPPA